MSCGMSTPVYEARCHLGEHNIFPLPGRDRICTVWCCDRQVGVTRIRQVTQVAGCHTPQMTFSGTMSGRQSRWDENVSHGTPGACNQWHLDDLHAIKHSVILTWLLPYTTFCLRASVAFMILYDNTDKGMKPVYLTHSNFLGDISIPPNLKTPMWYGLSQPRAAASRSQARRFFLKWSFTWNSPSPSRPVTPTPQWRGISVPMCWVQGAMSILQYQNLIEIIHYFFFHWHTVYHFGVYI